jgi:hypothetical protein
MRMMASWHRELFKRNSLVEEGYKLPISFSAAVETSMGVSADVCVMRSGQESTTEIPSGASSFCGDKWYMVLQGLSNSRFLLSFNNRYKVTGMGNNPHF